MLSSILLMLLSRAPAIDLFRGALPNENVVLAAHVFFNVVGEFVARHSNVGVGHNATKCNHCNLRSSSSDVYNHVAHGFFNVDADSNRGSHGFVNEVHFFATGMFCAVFDGSLLNICDARGDANDHA